MLWSRRRHEPLSAPAWDEGRVRAAIREIASDAESRFDADPRRLWPPHPLDEHVGPPPKGLYLGATGAIWSLHHLAREGAIELLRPLAPELDGVLDAYGAAPDSGVPAPSLFLGETGIAPVAERLAPAPRRADRLRELVAANIDNPAGELFWGSPGTMLAAVFLHEWTGEARFSNLALACAERLFAEWRPVRGVHLWTQRLYGDVLEYLGAAHGFAGNVHALLRCAPLLSQSRRAELYRRCAQVAAATAVVEGDCANWPPVAGGQPGRGSDWLVQWCHGAPGMVIALAGVPPKLDAQLDRLLRAAGELIWRAGPLTKGVGLCHGTAGNGYSFLKLHARDGESLWQERARAFAMHALGQWERMRARYGMGRYTLWTGDLGLALYLWDCVRGRAGLPSIDVL